MTVQMASVEPRTYCKMNQRAEEQVNTSAIKDAQWLTVNINRLTNFEPYVSFQKPSENLMESIETPNVNLPDAKLEKMKKLRKRRTQLAKKFTKTTNEQNKCISALVREKKTLENRLSALLDLSSMSAKIIAFLDVMKRTEVEIKASVLQKAFMQAARTTQEGLEVLNCKNIIKNTVSRMKAERRKKLLEQTLANFQALRRTFHNKADILRVKDYLAQAFGGNILKKSSEDMVLYCNKDLDMENASVVCAYIDGKFTKCLYPWVQTFELRLHTRSETRQRIATYAFAFLKGSKQTTYESFFDALKKLNCPSLPCAVTDFEI